MTGVVTEQRQVWPPLSASRRNEVGEVRGAVRESDGCIVTPPLSHGLSAIYPLSPLFALSRAPIHSTDTHRYSTTTHRLSSPRLLSFNPKHLS